MLEKVEMPLERVGKAINGRKECSGWIHGPKYAHIETILKNFAWQLRLEITTERDRGWFSENIRFRVEGEDKEVNVFLDAIHRWVRSCNGEVENE